VIDQVKIPPSVDRQKLIVRADDNEFKVWESSHWNTPLREEIRPALRANLEDALADMGDGAPSTLTVINLNIINWDASPQVVYFKAEYYDWL
jgi:uncharacterized lipoprotein YmbA